MNELEEIKIILSSLVEIEQADKWNLSNWNKLASEIYEIEKRATVELPEIVWHYLSDSAIRNKEKSEYTQHQILEIKKYLKNG